jgi:hypothetical protein
MTQHSLLRELLKIILHPSLPIRAPIKDLHREPAPCTRFQHCSRYVYNRQIVAIKWNRAEVIAPSPTRPQAAFVFFVL